MNRREERREGAMEGCIVRRPAGEERGVEGEEGKEKRDRRKTDRQAFEREERMLIPSVPAAAPAQVMRGQLQRHLYGSCSSSSSSIALVAGRGRGWERRREG